MKKSSDNYRKQTQQDYTRVNKAYRSTSSNSNLNFDSQASFNSRSKKKGNEDAVILGINASSGKNVLKDGSFKVHHYRNNYDPELDIETSQIIIKRIDQLIALDKYAFSGNQNKKGKKVCIVGVTNENQESNHRHRIKNKNPKPNQITATAVLTPDGLYQQISSTDAEYITVDSSAAIQTNDSNESSIRKQVKSKLESSFESSDIFNNKLSPTKSVQADIVSSFVDSNIGISPRNPHGLWKNKSQNSTIEEIEYEYVTVDEEEEKNEKKIEDTTTRKREVSFDFSNNNNNSNNQTEEEEVEYVVYEEEEEEEEVELESVDNNQTKSIQQNGEEEEYEYITVFEEEEESFEDKLVPSNSLGDVQPLNVYQQEKSINKKSEIQNSDYDDENDYATEGNINTQSFVNSDHNKADNDENIEDENESIENASKDENSNENKLNNSNLSRKSKEDSVINENNNDSYSKDDDNDEERKDNSTIADQKSQQASFQQEKQNYDSDNSQSHKTQLKPSEDNADQHVNKSDILTSVSATNNNEVNNENKPEKKVKLVSNGSAINESIDVNNIQFSTANQSEQKDSEPTVSVFEAYVFSDENKRKPEEQKKSKLNIGDSSMNTSYAFSNSQVQERNERQISNTLTNLVNSRNQILKSSIESTEININIVDDFDHKSEQKSSTKNSDSPSKTPKKLFLSPSNAVESRTVNAPNENSKLIDRKEIDPLNEEKERNHSSSRSQFEFENNRRSIRSGPDEQDKSKGFANDQTIATCDLDMSNIQRSPPAISNKNQIQNKDYNSDEYYSHEYYTTLDTRDQVPNTNNNNNNKNNNKNNKNQDDKKNKSTGSNRNSKKNNKKYEDDSYYSYSYYSDTYTYSQEPSTIENKSRRSRHNRRRRDDTEFTYEYVTNTTYETMDREIRPVNNKNNRQLPIELQKQIQQQLQQQIQQNAINSSNQSTPISVRLRVKDSQRQLFDLGNGQSPKFILKTVSADGKSTPHDIHLVLETPPSSSTRTSTATSATPSLPASPTQKRPEERNSAVKFDIPQIIESGPHKGMVKRRIKKSEKAKRDSERLMQVEKHIKEMEKKIIEQDEKKQSLADTSVEITSSYTGQNDTNSPFARSKPVGRQNRGKKPMRGKSGKIQDNDSLKRSIPRPISNSSSSANSPGKRRYYDENGNPVLVEVSDKSGRPVFRRIVGKSSASSSVRQGKSNPNMRVGAHSLPRPARGRNAASDNEQPNRARQQLFGTPQHQQVQQQQQQQQPGLQLQLPQKAILGENKPIKKSDVKTAKIEDRNVAASSGSDSDEDDENFGNFNRENEENLMEFGKVFRSRKAPHIKREKFQNPQIHLRPRSGNPSAGPSGGSTPQKRSVFDSDSDSEDDSNPFSVEPRNMSPSTRRKKREELEKEIEHLKQMLPDQAMNEESNRNGNERYESKKKITKNSPSVHSDSVRNTPPKKLADNDDNENDPFYDYDANLQNLQRSPYDQDRNININNNNAYIRNKEPFQLNLNPKQRQVSDGSTSSLTRRRNIPKITVEIPSRGNDGQADVFRRHYENASPEKAVRKGPDRYRDFNEYDEDDSVPLNASTKNTFKNLDDENDVGKEKGSPSSNSSKKRARRRIRVSLHDGSRSPAPHSSNPLKDSQQQSSNHYSNANSPSKKQREMIGKEIKPFIENLKAHMINGLSSSDDEDENIGENQQNDDPDSIGAMNPVQAMKLEEKKQRLKQKDIMPLTPPADADLNTTSSMLSNVPPPSPKNQDIEIVYKNGKKKRKKKVPISSSKSGTHSHSSKSSGTRGNVIRSHHLKDSQKYQIDSPPPSVLSSIINDDENEEEENSTFIQDVY